MCCQDDAALCLDCDIRVHAANKLATKHQRVSLLTVATAPTCDICQEKTGYYFCLEDRALLCRDCDLSIHSVNTLSSNHQRFLLPGIRVSLEAISVPEASKPVPEEAAHFRPAVKQNAQFAQYEVPQYEPARATSGGRRNGNNSPHLGHSPSAVDTKPPASVRQSQPQIAPQPHHAAHPARIQGGQGDFNGVLSRPQGSTQQARTMTQQNVSNAPGASGLLRRSSITEFLTEGVPSWRMDDLLSFADIGDGYNNTADFSSSKADMGSLGDFDWAADFNLFDDQVFDDAAQHEVPQMPSPPTASGLSRGSKVVGAVKGNFRQDPAAKFVADFDNSFVVPDLGLQNSPPPISPPGAKRRRSLYV